MKTSSQGTGFFVMSQVPGFPYESLKYTHRAGTYMVWYSMIMNILRLFIHPGYWDVFTSSSLIFYDLLHD